MCLGVLDKTRLTALQSHHRSVQDWQPLRLRRMSGSSLFLSFIPSVSLTSFSFISSPLHSFHLFFSYPCQLSFILYGLLSWLLHINGNLELPEQRSECLLLAFESGGHKCFLVPQNYILSTELFREILVRVHWLWFALTFPIGFRDLDVTCNIHCCFRCTFSPNKAQCVSLCVKSISVFLIMAQGCSSAQAMALNALLILSVVEQRETDWGCVCVCLCVSHLTLILSEKLPTERLSKVWPTTELMSLKQQELTPAPTWRASVAHRVPSHNDNIVPFTKHY